MIRDMRDAVLRRNGNRAGAGDVVEFTFLKGRWNHLGEATLFNRVKSHPDVGERWYPEIMAAVRAEQVELKEKAERKAAEAGQSNVSIPLVNPASIQAH